MQWAIQAAFIQAAQFWSYAQLVKRAILSKRSELFCLRKRSLRHVLVVIPDPFDSLCLAFHHSSKWRHSIYIQVLLSVEISKCLLHPFLFSSAGRLMSCLGSIKTSRFVYQISNRRLIVWHIPNPQLASVRFHSHEPNTFMNPRFNSHLYCVAYSKPSFRLGGGLWMLLNQPDLSIHKPQ
jgi:hypothetical protein